MSRCVNDGPLRAAHFIQLFSNAEATHEHHHGSRLRVLRRRAYVSGETSRGERVGVHFAWPLMADAHT